MISYKRGFKYQLEEDYTASTGVLPANYIETKWIILKEDGTLILKKGYAWDGSSGVFDTKSSQQASAEHDAFYKLMRYGLLSHDVKKSVDKRYRNKCVEDGMWRWRANMRYNALIKIEAYTKSSKKKKIYRLPKGKKNGV